MIIGCLEKHKIGDIFSIHRSPWEPSANARVIRLATREEYDETIKNIPEAVQAARDFRKLLDESFFYEVLVD